MIDRPRATPDGQPKQPARDRDRTTKSKVSEMQDPLICGDVGKAGKRQETGEANVGKAGEMRRKNSEVDLLH